MDSLFNELNSDLVLHVVQYLNIQDSSRLAASAKRYYYLVHQFRLLRGPELTTVPSWDKHSLKQLGAKEVATRGIQQLQTPPNLVLSFTTPRSTLSDELSHGLPPNAIVLGAIARSIQVNHPNPTTISNDTNVEHKSNASVMYASFPHAEILPFAIDYGPNMEDEIETLKQKLQENSNPNHWKAMIVYAAGDGVEMLEPFVSTMQHAIPKAAIVGGIAAQGYVSHGVPCKQKLSKLSVAQLRRWNAKLGGRPNIPVVEKIELVDHILRLAAANPLHHAEDTVFGVVLGGEAPVRSMVSRGVQSVTQPGVSTSSSPLVVQDVSLVHPQDEEYIFQGADEDLKPMYMIKTVRDMENNEKIMPATELMAQSNIARADFIGLKRPGQDGFELHMLSPYCRATQSYLIMTDGSSSPEQLESLQNAEIDFFVLDGQACLDDMDVTVSKLQEQTKGEEILGAVMYSCDGRGPERGGLIRETMADATRFAKGFPNVPCLGFYAGGEVGPMALAGNETVFQTGQAAVQGFTAVFCLFIVPVVDRSLKYHYHLDDCTASVMKFAESRLLTPSFY